ncbi:MAG: hypothetical protein GY755_14995 [Chloroflexi bacterium]|nr:hypothetical protein [Chloroflexota bacterium]
MSKLSLGYAIGAPATFNAIKIGKKLFRKLVRQRSSAIIRAGKGDALYDMKKVTLTSGVKTRIVIVRRINRTKKRQMACKDLLLWYCQQPGAFGGKAVQVLP